jgi:hypothetical protein
MGLKASYLSINECERQNVELGDRRKTHNLLDWFLHGAKTDFIVKSTRRAAYVIFRKSDSSRDGLPFTGRVATLSSAH